MLALAHLASHHRSSLAPPRTTKGRPQQGKVPNRQKKNLPCHPIIGPILWPVSGFISETGRLRPTSRTPSPSPTSYPDPPSRTSLCLNRTVAPCSSHPRSHLANSGDSKQRTSSLIQGRTGPPRSDFTCGMRNRTSRHRRTTHRHHPPPPVRLMPPYPNLVGTRTTTTHPLAGPSRAHPLLDPSR